MTNLTDLRQKASTANEQLTAALADTIARTLADTIEDGFGERPTTFEVGVDDENTLLTITSVTMPGDAPLNVHTPGEAVCVHADSALLHLPEAHEWFMHLRSHFEGETHRTVDLPVPPAEAPQRTDEADAGEAWLDSASEYAIVEGLDDELDTDDERRPDLDPNYKHLSSEDRDALWDDHQRQVSADRPNVNVAFPNGRCNACGTGLDRDTTICLNVDCSQCPADLECAECGLPMELDANEVAHHTVGGMYGDGYDADGDHVPFADPDDAEEAMWPECGVCGNDVHPNAVATYRPAITCEPCLDNVTCELCGNRNDDGEGYDGLCGNCADKRENDPVCDSCDEPVGENPFAVYDPAPVCQPCFDQQTCERCGNGYDGLCSNCADLHDDEPLEGHRRKRAAKAVQTITGLPLSSCYRLVDGTLPASTIDVLDQQRAFWAAGVVAAYRSGQANARAVAYLLGCLTSGVVNVQFDHKATVAVSGRTVVLETAELNRPVIDGAVTVIEGAHPTHFDALSAARTIADAL